jgi:hypothetical protein
MSFEADVLVMAPNEPDVMLAAYVRNAIDPDAVEPSLRRYMLDTRCSLALLVSPDRTWIYRDTYRDFTESSVELVGEFSTTDILGVNPAPQDERALSAAVSEWLEHLAAVWPTALPASPEARAPVAYYLVPAVAEGRVLSGRLG